MGGTPDRDNPAYWNGDNVWVSISDISALDDPLIQDSREKITDLGVSRAGIYAVSPGTLLLTFKLSIGKRAIAGTRLYTNEAIVALPIKDKYEMDVLYLYYALGAIDWSGSGQRAVKGATLNKAILSEIEVPVPSLTEQRRIAAILRAADEERRRRRYTQTLSDGLLGEVFVRMFYGDQAREWRHISIKELASYMRTGPFGSQLLHSEFVDHGIAVLGIDNAVQNRFVWDELRFITLEKYQELKRYTVHPGDILITIMGTCGRSAIVPDDIPLAINTKHLCCITINPSECLPSYLHTAFLYHPDALRQLGVSERGAVMPGLNMDIIGSLVIPLPPLELQQQFAVIAATYEQTRRQQQESARQSEHLFDTLLHRAFAGAL
jgi:type I restriction enzyme, S subunit